MPPGSWEQGFKTICNFHDQQNRVEVKKSLSFEAPNKYFMSGKLNHAYIFSPEVLIASSEAFFPLFKRYHEKWLFSLSLCNTETNTFNTVMHLIYIYIYIYPNYEKKFIFTNIYHKLVDLIFLAYLTFPTFRRWVTWKFWD